MEPLDCAENLNIEKSHLLPFSGESKPVRKNSAEFEVRMGGSKSGSPTHSMKSVGESDLVALSFAPLNYNT